MVRIGVIGAGRHSSDYHGPGLMACRNAKPGQVTLAAVCDLERRRAEQYARRFGFERAYTDWREMLEREGLDGLVAVTPPALTAKLVAELLPCGVPLLIEKPPGVASTETRKLLAAARKSGTRHMLSFNRRFSPAFLRAARWMAADAPQRPERVDARMLRVGRTEPDFVLGTGIHLVDTVNALLGRPVRVKPLPTAEPRRYEAEVSFESGAVARLLIAPEAGSNSEAFDASGDRWTVHIDVARCYVLVFDGLETAVCWRAPTGASASWQAGAVHETRAFIASLRGERAFSPDLEDGLAAMLVCEAVQQRRTADVTL
jgi:predicted dehydrogenase